MSLPNCFLSSLKQLTQIFKLIFLADLYFPLNESKTLLTMQRKIIYSVLIVFSCFCTTLIAQTASTETDYSTSTTTEISSSDDNWSFFHDAESSTYFIDFESISLNLNEIIVLDKNGKEVLRDNVVDLPVNSIYEINTSDYAKGEYKVELRSYTKTLSKEISVK